MSILAGMPLTPKGLHRVRRVVHAVLGLASALGWGAAPDAFAATEMRAALSDSIKNVAALASPGTALDPDMPTVVRPVLSDAELSETIQFEVVLKMRDLTGLQARTAKGEVIRPSEMADRYYPRASDYDAAIEWIEALGLKVTNRFDDHLSFFVQGSVSQIRDTLFVNFARVAYQGREYTSAVSAPSVLTGLLPTLVGINGLQPHIRLRPCHTRLTSHSAADDSTPAYKPAQISQAYQAKGAGVTGAGETIGIIAYAYPESTDLALFWSDCGISRTTDSITNVLVGSGAFTNPETDDIEEASLDVEWASSMAPGANIRVYGTSENDPIGSLAFQKVVADIPSQPQMHQISMSYGLGENELDASQRQADVQYFAAMAGMGVTLFFSSGDGGSRPDPVTGEYLVTATRQVLYPASDVSVTGVGGTTFSRGENAWFTNFDNYYGVGTGGGHSIWFDLPSWQKGGGFPGSATRMVPDVASIADPSPGAFVIVNGAELDLGGTSWSSPTWAGFCALFNQARIGAGLGPLGLLNPKIYPLNGGPCFNPIYSGNNGDYFVGYGYSYNLCTGLGSPNVGLLVQALAVDSPATLAPSFAIEPASAGIPYLYNATFKCSPVSFTYATYQWEVLVPGSTSWEDLTDTGIYAGSETTTLTVTGATTDYNGDQFRCVATNSGGSSVSSSAVLNVQPPVSTIPGYGPITIMPQSQTVAPGSTVVFTTGAQGEMFFSWSYFLNLRVASSGAFSESLKDGSGVMGSDGPQLVLSNVTAASAGIYFCEMVGSSGYCKTTFATLTVDAAATPATVSSISSRAFVGTGDDILIGGFYIVGSTSATVLIQAIGPALTEAPFNVTGTLQHPALTIHQSQNGKDVVLYSNTGWGSNPALLAAAAAAYAQPVLTPGSADSEVLLTLPPGGYTAEVTGADGGTGVALCAIYQLP